MFQWRSTFFACALVCIVAGAVFGYRYELNEYEAENEMKTAYVKAEVSDKTVFDFVYKYSDGTNEIQEVRPAEYMYGWNRDKIAQAYDNWNMVSFDADKAVFEKEIEGSAAKRYIVKELDGYLAVYYKENGKLKELTNVPIMAVDEADRERYKAGVSVDSDEALIRLMENIET